LKQGGLTRAGVLSAFRDHFLKQQLCGGPLGRGLDAGFEAKSSLGRGMSLRTPLPGRLLEGTAN
jgi:hypothetical protein